MMHSYRILPLAFLLLIPDVVLSRQASETGLRAEALVQQLHSSDPSQRGAAKLKLMQSLDPAALPLLLAALPSSSGEERGNLIEILALYKDARKIPALIKISRPFTSDFVYGGVHNQLKELGAPAAQALMDSVPEDCMGSAWEPAGYTSWVAEVVNDMGTAGPSALFAGLRSGEPCKQHAAEEGLLRSYMRPAREGKP